MRSALGVSLAFLLGAAALAPAEAMSIQHDVGVSSPTVLVAQGCGPGRWRGPWGHCRATPYSGPPPGGGYRCPPGSWKGPWGHCRNTPYRGPLPGGGYRY